jgi:hypothetical protein
MKIGDYYEYLDSKGKWHIVRVLEPKGDRASVYIFSWGRRALVQTSDLSELRPEVDTYLFEKRWQALIAQEIGTKGGEK